MSGVFFRLNKAPMMFAVLTLCLCHATSRITTACLSDKCKLLCSIPNSILRSASVNALPAIAELIAANEESFQTEYPISASRRLKSEGSSAGGLLVARAE